MERSLSYPPEVPKTLRSQVNEQNRFVVGSSSLLTRNQIFAELLSKIEKPTLNDKLVAINRAHILALRLTDAKEVLNMFLSSERINSDLELALEYPDNWTQDFVVRSEYFFGFRLILAEILWIYLLNMNFVVLL